MSRQVQTFFGCIFLFYLFNFLCEKVSDINTILLQMDVFNTFIELLRQTGNVTKGQADINELRQVFMLFLFLIFFSPCYFYCQTKNELI